MKIIPTIFLCFSVGLPIIGCTTGRTAEDIGKNAVTVNEEHSVKELSEPNFSEQNAPAQLVARGANEFAFKLSSLLVENIDDNNFVCSPYSVWMPLAALVNATTDEHSYKPFVFVLYDYTHDGGSQILFTGIVNKP